MLIKKICKDINLNISDKYYIIFLSFFSILITVMMFKFHQSRGAFNSDIYVYLASALDYAGMNSGKISNLGFMCNSPLICYLTSLLFKLGFVGVNSIFFVTSIFSILGIFAMYIFLKIRFSKLLSLIGSLLYSSFSLTLFYFANGMLDVPAVSLILWTLIFTVAAVNKNPKYYILVALFFVMSFFTRFTTVYIISLIVLYILKDYDLVNLCECLFYSRNTFKQKIISFLKSYEFKWICISLIVGFSIVAYVFYIILSYNAPIGYFGSAMNSISRFDNPFDPNYITDKFFYIKNYLSLLFASNVTSHLQIEKFENPSLMVYLILLTLFFGFFIKFINIIKNKEFYKINIREIQYRTISSSFFLKIMVIVLFIMSVISFKFNYLYSVLCLWVLLIIVQSLVKKYCFINMDYFTLSLVCFGLFSFYIIIFSFLHLKCVRYILPTFPAFVYFVVFSLNNILDFIKYGWDNKNNGVKKIKSYFRFRISQILPLVLIGLLLFTAFNFTNTVEIDELGLNFDSTANFLLDYDSDYSSKKIAVSPTERYYEWYFQKDVDLISPKDYNSSDYDYILAYNLKNNNYHEIYRDGIIGVYERN